MKEKLIIQWKDDNSWYAGTTRGGLMKWSDRKHAKELTEAQFEALMKTVDAEWKKRVRIVWAEDE